MTDATDTGNTPADSRYASRKFRITVGILLGAFLVFATGLLAPALFVDLVKWIAGLYFGANVVTWGVSAISSALAGKATP